jgi:mRNA interferase MazF
MNRGEVWLVRLDPTQGREQAGTRPALIVSSDRLNRSRAELLVVVPITSKERPSLPRVLIDAPDGGLSVRSWAICEQPRTIAKGRAIRRLGIVKQETLRAVATQLRWILEL